MHPTHNSSSEVELEFCKRIIRNGLKQQKCQAYYTITRSGTAYFICSGPRQFLTGTHIAVVLLLLLLLLWGGLESRGLTNHLV